MGRKIALNLAATLKHQEPVDLLGSDDYLYAALDALPAAVLRTVLEEIGEERRERIPTAVRRAVLKRDRNRCQGCGRRKPLHIHHVKPVAEGGRNETANLITLCPNCHAEVHAGLRTVTRPRRAPL